MLEILHFLFAVREILREDPRIGVALAILVCAGAIVAVPIGKGRREQPISIRQNRK